MASMNLGLTLSLMTYRKADSAAEPYSTVDATSVTITDATFGDVTYNFDTSVKVGWYTDLNGNDLEPFVVSDTAFNITSITPASSSGSNGAVVDPFTDTEQGFDAWIDVAVGGTSGAQRTTYNSALNIDPGNTASSYAVSLGDNKSIVKATRVAGAVSTDWHIVGAYKVLHVVSEVPSSDAFPPAWSEVGVNGTPKTVYSKSGVNLSRFRNLTLPASFTTSYATALGNVPPQIAFFGSTNGDKRRRFRLDKGYSGVLNGYSASICQYYTDYLILAHSSSTTTAQKKDIATWAILAGQQVLACNDRGGLPVGEGEGFGAGQGGAIGLFAYYFTSLLGQRQSDTQSLQGQQTTNGPYWATSGKIGTVGTAGFDTVRDNVSVQTHLDEHLGVPLSYSEEPDTSYVGRYVAIGRYITVSEQIAVLYLTNGEELLVEGATANDTSNINAARLAFLNNFATFRPDPGSSWTIGTDYEDLLDQVLGLTVTTAWTGQPMQLPYEGFTFGDGQVSWDISSYDFTTETATQTDFRYSLDGYSWIEVLDVGDNSSQTGLLKGVEHFVGIRRQSASGAGPWSKNQPKDVDEGAGETANDLSLQVNYAATTGTDTNAAPVNTVAPAIFARKYEAWGYNFYEFDTVSGTTFNTTVTELVAGVGYYTGYPAPTFTYQWKLNGSNISGATNKTIALDSSWVAGDTITCEVTATNASGSVTTETAATTVPTFIVRYIDNSGLIQTSGTTVNIGNPSTNRHLLLVLGAFENPTGAVSASSVSIAGQSCSRISVTTGGLNSIEVWVTDSPVTTGTTGTFNYTLNRTPNGHGWYVHEFNTTNTAVSSSDNDFFAGAATLSTTVNVPANSFVLNNTMIVSNSGSSSIEPTGLNQFFVVNDTNGNDDFSTSGKHLEGADATFDVPVETTNVSSGSLTNTIVLTAS